MSSEKRPRWTTALLSAVAAFFAGFVIFNIVFITWAEKTYPRNNSMAGVAAFYYGFPVALGISLLTFLIVFATVHDKPGK